MPRLDATTPPVPGYEALRFTAPPFRIIGASASAPWLPRLARVGPDEVVLAYAERDPYRVVSHRIPRAFSAWPPEVEPPIERLRGDRRQDVYEIVGYEDGSFALSTEKAWFQADAGAPGLRYALPHRAFPDLMPDGEVFTLEPDRRGYRVVRRTRGKGAHIADVGHLPRTVAGISATATHRHNLTLVTLSRRGGNTIHVLGDGRLTMISANGWAPVAEQAAPTIPRRGGGAFTGAFTSDRVLVESIEEDGSQIGDGWWVLRDERGDPRVTALVERVVAFAPWREGFVLAATRTGGGIGLVVSDGKQTTFGVGTVWGDGAREGLVASDGGSVILFAYERDGAIEIARLSCGVEDGEPAFLPERPPARAASPGFAAARGPVVTLRDDILRRIRQRHILAAFGPVAGKELICSYQASGDATAGHYESDDGSGNSFVVFWDASGLVALGFDHDHPESEYMLPLNARRPKRRLPKVPPSMAALVRRATTHGERLATEGLWIGTGPSPAEGRTKLDVLNQLLDDLISDAWFDPSDETWELAGRMAASESYRVTAEDEQVLARLAEERDRPLAVPDVERTAKALAAFGIAWRDGPEPAHEALQALLRARDD